MQLVNGRIRASPTDLANFLGCRHKTELDELVARGRLQKPVWTDPLREILQQRGETHEQQHVAGLAARGLAVVDLGDVDRGERPARTVEAMRAGADVIVQAALANDRWLGYADVLRKIPMPSPLLGAWSYEAHDTKLSRETRGGTILQLCVYSELVGEIQGCAPALFHVVTPIRTESYRFDDFGAFYRQVCARFWEFVESAATVPAPSTYPEPNEHCDVCHWFGRCNGRRRADDHLSFVAGLGRQHQRELSSHDVTTLKALATTPLPIPFKPSRGATDTYVKLREQARLQHAQRQTGEPTCEDLPVEEGFGLTQLPEPRPGDLFLDLEGDPFGRLGAGTDPGEATREYLFGLARLAPDGAFDYRAWWAFTDVEEREAFEAVMTEIMAAVDADPLIRIYHYGSYEQTAFKRLMGRYATREADVDRLLRGRRFVDLLAIIKRAIRAGVERYSIKDLEPFYAFQRDVPLQQAGDRRRVVEIALETGDLSAMTDDVRSAVVGYNRDDCRSVAELRRWLESRRASLLEAGANVPRPPAEPDAPTEDVKERQRQVNELRARLLDGMVAVPSRDDELARARYLLAYMLDWHYREDKVGWWEYFRLRDLTDDELLDEPKAISGLTFQVRLGPTISKKTGKPLSGVIDRYMFPPQECEIRAGAGLKTRDGKAFADVVAIDRDGRTVDLEKSRGVADFHPRSAFAHKYISPKASAAAIFRIGEQVADGGFEAAPKPAADLLLRRLPLVGGSRLRSAASQVADYAVEVVGSIADTTLSIQGPPGSGKTYTGARMICALVKARKRVGVTATSHKVIRNLLDAVAREAAEQGCVVRLGHKDGEDDYGTTTGVETFEENDDALAALKARTIDVLGGTAWLWSRREAAGAADVLFVDEAGQMSLANALAVSHAATTLVLLGDPQQLEQPQKGSHPDGVDVSALDHVLGDHQTMPEERGLFLPITWRLAPSICKFTSELFYEDKLTSLEGLEHQAVMGAGELDGSGLLIVDADHDGCRNASDEEVELVARLIQHLRRPGTRWIDRAGQPHPLSADDILVVAPYNAHVARLQERLGADARVGTVDKFQGQEAPVVIYSMATSRPEDAPRGMEFLYSLNRLNVATSRARCASILVASPRLFEPDCRTPRQMQLANALARYRELARRVLPEMQ